MAETSTTEQVHDLIVLVDATYSMDHYLKSLQVSLPQIISLSALTNCFRRLGIIAYRDYCDNDVVTWSGWFEPAADGAKAQAQVDLIKMAKDLEALGGGDLPEATKTGLAKAYSEMDPEAKTLVLIYTDAPPHMFCNGFLKEEWSNLGKELKALEKPHSYDGFGPKFADWVSAADTLRNGRKSAQVFSILDAGMAWEVGSFYQYLSTVTGGACFFLTKRGSADISQVTIEILLSWMGAEKAGVTGSQELSAFMSRYVKVNGIKTLKDEQADECQRFFFVDEHDTVKRYNLRNNLTRTELTTDVLKKHLPKKAVPVENFAKRYKFDAAYKKTVGKHIRRIVEDNVTVISVNPVFGSLWRALCNDRDNPERESLISAFGASVEKIKSESEKVRMKAWLEESYDFTAEVVDAIHSVPKDLRFPCVLLDPTLKFTLPKDDNEVDGEDEEAQRPITEFRRDELLEIGRSCDYKILRRLGKVLTRLTFVETAEDLPAHVAAMSEEEVPKIPLALAKQEYGNRLWRIMLHLVVPGTMLAARPAALLAALAIRMGIRPLFAAADEELIRWRARWNNIEIPETWNVSCMSLLLDADKAYRNRMSAAEGSPTSKKPVEGLLTDDDRKLFEALASYKMLEMNLKTALTAEVGWTPEKTRVPMGPIAVCRNCKYPRSVTIMSKNSLCGICAADDYKSDEQRQQWITGNASKSDSDKTMATWVECFVQTCRAQYVVYAPNELNVRPKCFYCRYGKTSVVNGKTKQPDQAPVVECQQCLSRVIWPKEYRPSAMSKFTCSACTHKMKTVTSVETDAQHLSAENSYNWLLKNTTGHDLLTNRSLFYVASTVGPSNFLSRVQLFPQTDPQLSLRGKPLHNTAAVLTRLKSFITSRRTESTPCTLCFTPTKPAHLHPPCRRSGCHQRICTPCLTSWYGLNAPGRVLNPAALHCPFCRRLASARLLAKYANGAHSVRDLRPALAQQGEFVFAWCLRCLSARVLAPRECARGPPPDVSDFVCADCRAEILAELAREEEAAAAAERERARNPNAQIVRVRPEPRSGEKISRDWRTWAKKFGKVKDCPGCEFPSQRDEGCGHVQCGACGTHWCWFCRWEAGKDARDVPKVYDHMDDKHGGCFADEYIIGEDDDE